jgi:hypothetical protein
MSIVLDVGVEEAARRAVEQTRTGGQPKLEAVRTGAAPLEQDRRPAAWQDVDRPADGDAATRHCSNAPRLRRGRRRDKQDPRKHERGETKIG